MQTIREKANAISSKLGSEWEVSTHDSAIGKQINIRPYGERYGVVLFRSYERDHGFVMDYETGDGIDLDKINLTAVRSALKKLQAA